MNFICPHCGNNSFRITTEHVGAQHAECIRCGEITAFAVDQMDDDGGHAGEENTGNAGENNR